MIPWDHDAQQWLAYNLMRPDSKIYFDPSIAQKDGSFMTWIDKTQPHRIPSVWPMPQEQHGQCCGFYALSIALQAANQCVLPARKRDLSYKRNLSDGFSKKQPPPSLRNIAKERKLTTIGEILDVNVFAQIVANLPFQALPGEAIRCDENNFIQILCQKLDDNKTVIVSCDMDTTHREFPGQSRGNFAHWALAFGYCHIDNRLCFLVTHHNLYCLWTEKRLLQSNQQDKNAIYPKSALFGRYLRVGSSGTDYCFYNHQDNSVTRPLNHLIKIAEVPKIQMHQFYCSLFAYPMQTNTARALFEATEEEQLAG